MKDVLRITKNYKGLTLTAIVAVIYNALLLNPMPPEVNKILLKNQKGFRINRPTTSQNLNNHRIIKGIHTGNKF